jgi:bacteriorhodopsin
MYVHRLFTRIIFMPTLSIDQYDIVTNLFSFTFICMSASFMFFLLVRNDISSKLRGALTMSAIVVLVAAYNYWVIKSNWLETYKFTGTEYIWTGVPFRNIDRYADWLLTVPLLIAALVAILGLPQDQSRSLTWKLGGAAALMIILGYPGEVANTILARTIWGGLASVPFVYILVVLFIQLGPAISRQPATAQILVRNIRIMLLLTWGFYPIVYLLPIVVENLYLAPIFVALQIGYGLADILAKCGYGVLIYAIGRAKMDAEVEMARAHKSRMI